MSAEPIRAFEGVPFTQVDAFSSTPFSGNPAAVLELKEFPPDEVLTVSMIQPKKNLCPLQVVEWVPQMMCSFVPSLGGRAPI